VSIASCKSFLSEIRQNPGKFLIIHYSCQSLYDDNEGLSPRITSIVVSHFATDQTKSFSTHAVAEELGIRKEDVIADFDKVEKRLLERFFEFAKDNNDKVWIHWNMRNLVYGFEHLEHRHEVLTKKKPNSIPIEMRVNLNDIVADRYGGHYVEDPKMISLMNLNGGRHRHFLTGKEEVEAFKNGEYIRMHNSTLCKVGFFNSIIKKIKKGKLKTESRSIGVRIDKLLESRFSKVIALVVAIFGPVVTYFLQTG